MNRFRRDEQIGWIRQQADACRDLDSPLWGAVLDAMAQDVAVDGPTLRVLQARPDSRFGDAVALRLIGCAHRLALSGHAPDLASFLPSCGGRADANEATTEVLRLVEERATDFIAALNGPPQRNEVGRAAGLVLGLLWASRRFEHPLRLREMGCSGGLNLRMDAFHFSHGEASMGPPDSPVNLHGVWDRAPELADLVIADRAGCDPAPVDVTTAAGALWLQSFVWPDQTARFTRLNGAIELAG